MLQERSLPTSPTSELLVPLIQTTALTWTGVLAGYAWALSHAAIPAILYASDPLLSRQWRRQYLAAFYISRPLCILNFVSFGYLCYSSLAESLERTLYGLAGLLSSSGMTYALTFLRRTNGALSLGADKVVGRHRVDPLALTYARGEKGSVKREKGWKTEEMVKRWRWHNNVRTAMLMLGTLLGGLAVGVSKR